MTETIETTERKGKKGKATGRKSYVLIDYRGSVGRATQLMGALRDNLPVKHVLSPLCMFWPENGTPWLNLQPGLNRVDSEIWELYTSKVNDGQGHPQLRSKIDRGLVREITALPNDPWLLSDLIERSIDIEALRWILDQEEKGAARTEVLSAVKARLARAHPAEVRQISYQGRAPNLKTDDRVSKYAMG